MNYNCGEKNIGCLYHGWLPAGGRGGRGRGKHEDMRHIAKEYSEQITKLMYSRLKTAGHFDLVFVNSAWDTRSSRQRPQD